VIHEAGQREGIAPPWKDTFSAMFGDHVKWDEIRVFANNKIRPMSECSYRIAQISALNRGDVGRPIQTCQITGKEAKYLDPRSGVPFADIEAFRVLTEVLAHEYIWDPTLKRYVGHEGLPK
jgi:hypothetical protein